MSWFVLYTAARAEKKVRDRVAEIGYEVFLPIHKVKRKWSDRIKVVEQPLFSSYVFVDCPEHKLRDLLLIYGVSKIVFYLGRPALVKDSEIEAIKEFLDIAANKEIITNGDEVEIICGPFVKKRAKVLNVTEKAAYLFLEELGAKICVSLQNIDKLQTK